MLSILLPELLQMKWNIVGLHKDRWLIIHIVNKEAERKTTTKSVDMKQHLILLRGL